MSKSWARGSTRAWRRIRAEVLLLNRQRNGGRCTLQLDGCTGQADQVHHTVGRAVTGDDPRYLVAACGACNRKLGNPKTRQPRGLRMERW